MNCRHGKSSLCLAAMVIAIVWMVVLPWIGARERVRARIEHMDRLGIDPAALYYTDLEATARLESELAAIRQAHPDAFWRPGSAAAR